MNVVRIDNSTLVDLVVRTTHEFGRTAESLFDKFALQFVERFHDESMLEDKGELLPVEKAENCTPNEVFHSWQLFPRHFHVKVEGIRSTQVRSCLRSPLWDTKHLKEHIANVS